MVYLYDSWLWTLFSVGFVLVGLKWFTFIRLFEKNATFGNIVATHGWLKWKKKHWSIDAFLWSENILINVILYGCNFSILVYHKGDKRKDSKTDR